jgi:pimeloyl-ACP methyl ester carboxylesterase
MAQLATSADGTVIGYDREGAGPGIVLVGGAFQHRALDPTTAELADRLAAEGYTVINYDRRGRGKSTDTQPYAVQREIEDLAAMLNAAGGSAAVFGNSSGSALCLQGGAAGLPITRIALWEPPFAFEAENDGGAFLAGLQDRIAAGDRAGAVDYFMSDMPPEWVQGAKASPAWDLMLQVAPTLAYDIALLDRNQHEPWRAQWAAVTIPVLVMVGEPTLSIFPPAAEALVAALPDASSKTIAASDHGWQPEVMCAELVAFLRS